MFIQESKAEKAKEALQEMAAATSKVLRDGKVEQIRSEDIVPGDIVLLEAAMQFRRRARYRKRKPADRRGCAYR